MGLATRLWLPRNERLLELSRAVVSRKQVTRKNKCYLTTSRLLQLVQLEGELSGQELKLTFFIKFEAEITVVLPRTTKRCKKKILIMRVQNYFSSDFTDRRNMRMLEKDSLYVC